MGASETMVFSKQLEATCGMQSCGLWHNSMTKVSDDGKKALRAAIMKSRFSETILKAQKKTLFDHDNKVDPLKMQREKKRFESIQLEEMSKIKAQMKEAEVDEVEAKLKQQMKNVEVDEIEAKLKHRRETKREAFRATLQKMTKTVDFEDNMWAQKEFDILIGSSCSYYWPRDAH